MVLDEVSVGTTVDRLAEVIAAQHQTIHHLVTSHPPRPQPSEQAALSMVRTIGQELHDAGQHLAGCAQLLKDSGNGHAASLAHQASQRALQQAAEILGRA